MADSERSGQPPSDDPTPLAWLALGNAHAREGRAAAAVDAYRS